MNTTTFVTCNQPDVTNRASVRQVFNGFVTPIHYDIHALPIDDPARVENPDVGTIKLKHDGWPTAVQCDLLSPEMDVYARDRLFRERGDAGFVELLGGLACFLKSELRVQAFSLTLRDGKASFKATEWIVRPGDPKVAVTTILPLQEGVFAAMHGRASAI